MKVLETAVGAVFASTRFFLVRISIRGLVADRKSLLRKSGVGGGGQILILKCTTPSDLAQLGPWALLNRRRTNVQQLTCNIDLSCSFYYLFLSFVLIELTPFVLKGKVLGEKVRKSAKNAPKSAKNSETILPFSSCPLFFLWIIKKRFLTSKLSSEDPCIHHPTDEKNPL